MGREHERDPTLPCQGPKFADRNRILPDLVTIASLEFLPARLIVPEPSAQRGARRDIFEPFINRGGFLSQAAGQSWSTSIRMPSSRQGGHMHASTVHWLRGYSGSSKPRMVAACLFHYRIDSIKIVALLMTAIYSAIQGTSSSPTMPPSLSRRLICFTS